MLIVKFDYIFIHLTKRNGCFLDRGLDKFFPKNVLCPGGGDWSGGCLLLDLIRTL